MEFIASSSEDEIYYDAKEDTDKLAVSSTTDTEVEKNPDLTIGRLKFLLTLEEHNGDVAKSEKLLDYITANNMAPYYELVCSELRWKVDESLLKNMKRENTETLEKLNSEIDYAQNNLGVGDLKEAYLNKARYLTKIGEKQSAINVLTQAYGNTVELGCKLDNIFHCIRIGLFFHDLSLIKEYLIKADSLIEEGADWHYRNCYKIYKGLYSMAVRDFATACEVFASSIATFCCTELISYEHFIKYTVICCMIQLNRKDLKETIVTNPEVLQALHSNPIMHRYVFSLYNGDFEKFIKTLAQLETEMKNDILLHPHYKHYVREMKIKAYDQLLSTYLSVKLSYMAKEFGLSEEYLEDEICQFVSAGRMNYKIDKISGRIINLQNKGRVAMYDKVVKHGDVLLNRVQKLSRVVII